MATAINPITGNLIRTKGATNAYRDGHSKVFTDKAPLGRAEKIDPQLKEEWGQWCKANMKKIDTIPTFEEWLAEHKDAK